MTAPAKNPRAQSLEQRAAAAFTQGDYPEVMRLAAELVQATNSQPMAWLRLDADAIFAPLPPVPWVVQALDIAPGPPSMIGGYGFSKKTLCTQAMAVAVAAGMALWNRWPVTQGRVLHVDYEQGMRLTRDRYQRLARAAGLGVEELRGQLEVVSYPPTYLDSPGAEAIFAREFEGRTMAIIDSFRAAAPKTDENSSEARVPLDMLARVSELTGCMCLVIHHARKPQVNTAGGAKMTIRGSSALFDACQSVIVLEGDAENGDEPSKGTHEKARITGTVQKPFALKVEDVVGEDGDPRWGLRVVATDAEDMDTERHEQEIEALTDHVLEVVRANAGASTRVICARSRKNYGKVLAALDMLESSGAVRNLAGGNKGAKWHACGPGGVVSP